MSMASIEPIGPGRKPESATRGVWSAQSRRVGQFIASILLLLACVGCAAPRGQSRVSPRSSSPEQAEVGVASYYAHKYHGKKTASGENYNMHELTAAHRTLPFGAKVRITNLNNNNSGVVGYASGLCNSCSCLLRRKYPKVVTSRRAAANISDR